MREKARFQDTCKFTWRSALAMRVKLNCKWLHRQWVARVLSNSLFLLSSFSLTRSLSYTTCSLLLVQLLLPSSSCAPSFFRVCLCVQCECVHLHHQASTIDSQHCSKKKKKTNWVKNLPCFTISHHHHRHQQQQHQTCLSVSLFPSLTLTTERDTGTPRSDFDYSHHQRQKQHKLHWQEKRGKEREGEKKI